MISFLTCLFKLPVKHAGGNVRQAAVDAYPRLRRDCGVRGIFVSHLLTSCLFQFIKGYCSRVQRLDGLNNRSLCSHSSGGQKFKSKAPTELVPSKGCEGRSYSRPLSLACGWPSSSMSSHRLSSVCACVQISSYTNTSHTE